MSPRRHHSPTPPATINKNKPSLSTDHPNKSHSYFRPCFRFIPLWTQLPSIKAIIPCVPFASAMKLRGASKYCPVVFIFCLFLYLFIWSHSSGSWNARSTRARGIKTFSDAPNFPETITLGRLGVQIQETSSTRSRIFRSPARAYHQDWQPVIGSESRFAVYSAYSFVNRKSPEVFLIGITQPDSEDAIRCHYHFSNQPIQSTEVAWKDLVPGSIETLRPGITSRYAAVFVRCPLPHGRPEMVSLLLNQNTTLTNWVRIQYGDESEDAPYQYTFSVCVKPTFNFNNGLRLLEWIEFYKLMGVEQFTFYNMTIGPEASCVLNTLVNGSDTSITVNVLPWRNHNLLDEEQLPGGDTPQSSQGAAQNECVYRHRLRRTKYMALVDLDEFIMPRENVSTNYREMMTLLEFHNGTEIGGYVFQNAFYVLSYPDNPRLLEWCSEFREVPVRYRICREAVMMKKVWRDEDLYEHGVRSKFIIKPEGVQTVSNHFIESFEEGYVNLDVPGSIATNRHYREFEEGDRKVVDATSKEFGLKLVGRLSKSVEPFMELCNLKLDSIGQ